MLAFLNSIVLCGIIQLVAPSGENTPQERLPTGIASISDLPRWTQIDDVGAKEDFEGTAEKRLLAQVSSDLPSSGIALRLSIGGVVSQTAAGFTLQTHAGKTISLVELILTNGDTFNPSVSSGRLRLVLSSVTRSTARAGACTDTATSLGLSSTNQPFADTLGATTTLQSGDTTMRATLTDGLVFKMGGSYRLCYSSDGSFGTSNTDVLGVTIDVAGVYDSCATVDCLSEMRYNCYALRGAHSTLGSCAVNFGGTGEGYQGSVGKISWSTAWVATWASSTGILQSLIRRKCGETAPDATVFCSDGSSSCAGTDRYVEPDAAQGNKVAILPKTQSLSNVSAGYSMAACYCPGLGSCDADAEFVQQVGVLYVFASKICDSYLLDDLCAWSAGAVATTPGHSFSIMVYCPPGGCAQTTANRIKLVDSHADNDRPSWESSHGCHRFKETSLQASPTNCALATTCTMTGGSRQDYKRFGGNHSGFNLAAQGSDLERLNFHSAKGIDICFCMDSCTIPTNWFKVGSMAYSPYRLASLSTALAKTVNVLGKLGFYRSVADENSIGLESGSVIKVLSDDSSSVNDTVCGSSSYDTSLVPGFSHSESSPKYSGQPYGGDSRLLVFDSGVPANTYFFSKAGVVAVCYCRLSNCPEKSSEWIFAARYVIQGPATNQEWTFSTGLAVRITYKGFSLSSSATLRLTPSTFKCTDFTNNPHSESSLQIGCPFACSKMSPTLGETSMNLATQVLTHSTVRCGAANTACESVYVSSVVVINSTSTQVEFTGDPGLSTGDRLVLSAGIQCGATCSTDQLTVVSGAPEFGNSGSYALGNPVIATLDANRYIIPVGWIHPVPFFDVPLVNGQWKRTNAASTAEELKGTAEALGLKVCWGHSGASTYVMELGVVNFVEPPTMATSVSLTTAQINKTARIVISFSTGSTRTEYAAAVNYMQLKIVFADVGKLEPHFTNQVPLSAVQGWDETELDKASQAACGKLFHELWSSHYTHGFPMPRGCYYKLTGQSRELYILFEKKNTLQPGKTYQVVLSATAKDGLSSAGPVVQVFSMQDVVVQPYVAVEEGSASVSMTVVNGLEGPRFAEPNGFTITGSTSSILELQGDLELKFQLAGHITSGIPKSSILRLFMWPLTQWNMAPATTGATGCTAVCIPFPGSICKDVSSCVLEAVVDGWQTNIVKLQLPSEMDTIQGKTKHVIYLSGVTLPLGGFFPGRIGVQVSESDDSKPHYVISSGDYIWKQADAVAAVSELVTKPGNGNSNPFKGATGNMLHAHFKLGTTLFVDGFTGFASMSVQMPVGYVCTSVSATPASLEMFSIISGPATLDASRWSCSGNMCTYTLEPYGAIFAGSSFYVSFTVTNPPHAMPRSHLANKWYLALRSAGDQTQAQTAGVVGFRTQSSTLPNSFSTHVAVLGTLGNHCIQPTDFTKSKNGTDIFQDLYVFFQTQQSAGFGAYVVLDAPPGFDFGSTCSSSNLDAAYYSSTTGNRVYPLPSMVKCTGTVTTSGTIHAMNRASIRLAGHLRAGRHYAFSMRVKNPDYYSVAQQSMWHLWTQTQSLDYVDGASGSSNFQLQTSKDLGVTSEPSWGMYQESLAQSHAAFHVMPLLPYSLTLEEATITVFPLRITADVNTMLRITAPYGYVWFFSKKDFVYHHHSSSAAGGVVGASADLPGGVPQRRGNLLEWPAAPYYKQHTYGFITYIRVPDFTPTQSSNAFFVEFGYNDRTSSAGDRSAAARVAAAPVRALRNGGVDYTSRIRGATNTVRFMIETATALPFQGGLLIVGPEGFLFSESCRPSAVASSVYKPLPADSDCTFGKTNSGEVHLSITAGDAGIPAGLYAFDITGKNPPTATANRPGEDTLCGSVLCWTFYSLEVAKDVLASTELDKRISIPSFAITNQMLSAMLLPLAELDQTTSGRDDRPLQPNWLTFTLQLAYDVTTDSTLTLRGPAGFVFPEDCFALSGVRTRLEDIIGSSTSPVEMHSAWEPSVPVTACEGNGPVAQLEVGAGLRRSKSYIFSIRVSANPERTPNYNKWVIEMPTESSTPFDGFVLWTFTEISIKALSSAVASHLISGSQVDNFVNITFRPYNDLDGEVATKGVLMLFAPLGYQLASGCDVHLEERDPLWPEETAPVLFSTADFACISGLNSNLMAVELKSPVLASRRYTWMVRLRNPAEATPLGTEAPAWELQSFKDRTLQHLIDKVKFNGFATNKAMPTWEYSGAAIENGGMRVDSMFLTLMFPDSLNTNDQIVILAPIGYDLRAPTNQEGDVKCNNLKWGPGDPSPITVYSKVACRNNQLKVLILEDAPILNGTTITLQISTTNPARQPLAALDFWQAQHVTPSGNVASSGVFQGWKIVPQLQQVQVLITGANIAAGSTTTLDFTFVAVSSAVSITISADEPVGFDFSFATLPLLFQTLIDAVNSLIRARVAISAGSITSIRVAKVKLAVVGGPTKFDLQTFSSLGTVVDQKLGFTGGFRLPGSIKATNVDLVSEYRFGSMYPVRSRWPPQFGKTVSAFFTLTFSNDKAVGQLLEIKCPFYSVLREPFSIVDQVSNMAMPVEVSFASGAELRAQLQAPLLSERAYRLNLQATAPLTRPASDVWTIQITDGQALPLAHSFVALDSFQVVTELGLKVVAPRSPPAAEVEVSLLIVLGETRPAVITLIAPPTFVFNSNCLVADAPGITGCVPGALVAGRATADLSCDATKLLDIVQGLKVSITTPSIMPALRMWFVEASMAETGALSGWGMDSTGITITPMQDVSAVYAGIPNIKSELAFSFRTSETIKRGGQIKIETPVGFVMSCMGSALKALSLPGVLDCKIQTPLVFLTLNDTLTPGEYAFAITVRTPDTTPSPNTFSLLLLDERGKVQDSAMKLPGQVIQSSLSAVGTPVKWTSSEPGQASIITVGFTVKEFVPPGVLGAILITFPENFGHAIEKASSVVSIGDELPLKQGGDGDEDWIDFRLVDRLTLLLDPSKRVEKGSYQIEFPITVPEQMPAYNVWQVTLCQHSNDGVCLQAQGPDSLVTFPFAGFYLGEVLAGMQTNAQQAHGAAATPTLRWWAVFVLVLARRGLCGAE